MYVTQRLCSLASLLLLSATPSLSATLPLPKPVALPDAPSTVQSLGESSSKDLDTPFEAMLPAQSGSQTTPPPTPSGQKTPAPPPQPPAQGGYDLKKAEHQRILGIMPEFQAVNNGADLAPLTPKEKFHLMWKSSTDPFIFSLDAIVAGIGQAKDSNPGYHQGLKGYARRFGASYADTFDGNFWGNAVLTVALKEDPRYYRKGEGYSPLHRALYSAGTAVWTRRDDGKHGPNYANVLGNIISGGISNIYYPAADRGIGKTFSGAATVTAEGTIGSELIEFWPDIARKLFPKRFRQQMDQAPDAPAPTPHAE